jgi:hypothetical protein
MLKSPITLKSGTKVSATSEVSMPAMLTLTAKIINYKGAIAFNGMMFTTSSMKICLLVRTL